MASDKMDRGLDEIIADKVGARIPFLYRQPRLPPKSQDHG